MIVIGVLSVVAASLLLTNATRYHTTYQSASWQEAIVASEAGVDLAMNELRNRVVSGPPTAFATGWTASNPSTGAAYGSYGHAFPATAQPYSLPQPASTPGQAILGNTATQIRVYVDVPGSSSSTPGNFAVANDNSFISQLDNPNLRDADGVDRSRWWYRIRALGIAGIAGPPRPNIDKRDNRLRQISFFNDWRTGQALSSPQAARLVEVVAHPLTNFRNALMADVQINLSNKDVLVDSYDSSKGVYSATANHGMMGNIATNGQLINANNAVVDGSALTNNGNVSGAGNVTGQQSSNFYQELTPLTQAMLNPAWSNVTDGGTITTNATFTASADSTNPATVRLDGVNLPDGGYIINLAAPASPSGASASATPTPSYIKVYVQGNITTTGSSYINIAPTVNAIIYFTGNVNLQGVGIINNSFLARQLVLNGVQPPANSDGTYPSRSISIATNEDFEGVIYAPNHDVSLALQAVSTSGSGSSNTVTGQITSLEQQITSLTSDIAGNQLAYNQAAAIYNLTHAPGQYANMQAAQTQIAADQAHIATINAQLQVLLGVNPTSSSADHAQGYNGIYGGFVGRTITVADKTHVHYDETLRTAGPVNHYEIVNWFEDNLSRDAAGGAEEFWWR